MSKKPRKVPKKQLKSNGIKATPDGSEKTTFVKDLVEQEIKRQSKLRYIRLSKTIRYPRDWWQAVRERFLPVWAKVRWPIVYTEHVYWESVEDKSTQSIEPTT